MATRFQSRPDHIPEEVVDSPTDNPERNTPFGGRCDSGRDRDRAEGHEEGRQRAVTVQNDAHLRTPAEVSPCRSTGFLRNASVVDLGHYRVDPHEETEGDGETRPVPRDGVQEFATPRATRPSVIPRAIARPIQTVRYQSRAPRSPLMGDLSFHRGRREARRRAESSGSIATDRPSDVRPSPHRPASRVRD